MGFIGMRPALTRRGTLYGCLVVAAGGTAGLARADESDPALSMPPQPGDQFGFLAGEKRGQVVNADDVPLGGPQVQAYPIDPKSRLMRDGSRLNLIILIRLDPSSLSEDTRLRAAGGVVAYSAVCTHQGCPVNMWTTEQKEFFCSCHGSVFDPRNGAQVLAGPAPRPLPSLGVKLQGNVPVVAAAFSGHVGPTAH